MFIRLKSMRALFIEMLTIYEYELPVPSSSKEAYPALDQATNLLIYSEPMTDKRLKVDGTDGGTCTGLFQWSDEKKKKKESVCFRLMSELFNP